MTKALSNLFIKLIVFYLAISPIKLSAQQNILKGPGVIGFQLKGIEFERFRLFHEDQGMLDSLNVHFGEPIQIKTLELAKDFIYSYQLIYQNFELKYYKKFGPLELYEMTLYPLAPVLTIGNTSILISKSKTEELNDIAKISNIEYIKNGSNGPNSIYLEEDSPYYFEFTENLDSSIIEKAILYFKHD